MNYDFRDKVIAVTGGAGGIGSAMCRRFAFGGARCVVVDIDEIRAVRVAGELPGSGHVGIGCDLMDWGQVERLFQQVDAAFGRLDVLVNNVGMTSTERFDVRDIPSIEREVGLNLVSPLVTTRLAIPLLRGSRDPRVISTVSLAGIFPQAETSVYCASKFGLRGAMLSIGLDLREKGILAGSVLPSATDTPMLRLEAVEGGNSMQFQEPPQQPSDVVSAVVSMLDKPRLEAYARPRESLSARLAMLVPNLLPKILPLFRKRGDRGMARYLEDLERRGLARRTDGRWELVAER
ncbi:oxidoreductase [Saccharothrix sp. ALI-22-I]|uniref:SDR family NAD(P)-dependent oxidoreductase n=1 Tax=Saccharothrix sp. ALI-22-I TaxID=1933778 RepID=UPI00097BE59C|nr:SDR family oxidoreductase [Saccharothrix sp. ALI-22-I]ONI91101.1 oxidoreductase [Saccharothrix sp. ALI-22-I]